MKAKVGRGDGFRGVLDYALGKNKGAEIVGGTISSATPRLMAQEFGYVRKLRPDAKNPVWHCSLSLPKGEYLDSEKWDALAFDFMKEMDFSELTPWVAVRHRDTDHDHVHIIASRIDLSSGLWHGKWEARRAIEATQTLEKAHGLTLTAGLGDVKKDRKQLKKSEIEMALRTEEQPPKLKLQNIIDEALSAGDLTAVQFAETLELSGVEVKANLASTGRLNGFSFSLDGVAFKGSNLGKGYTWSGLQKRGVTYEQDRDYTSLARFSAVRVSESHKSAIRESRSDRPDFRDIRPDGEGPIKGESVSRASGESSEADTAGNMENTQSSEFGAASALEKTDTGISGGRDPQRKPSSGWNARFKQASAKARDKRHATAKAAGSSNTGGNRIAVGDLQTVKQTDPR